MLALFFTLSEIVSARTLDVRSIAEDANAALAICPQKLWPSFSLDGRAMLLLYDPAQQAWYEPFHSTGTSLPAVVPYSRLPHTITHFGGTFAFVRYRARDTIELLANAFPSEASAIFELAHESFHKFGQGDFLAASTQQRGYVYPEPWNPRYLRHEIGFWLERSVKERAARDLSVASYWYHRYLHDFPNDADSVKSLDRLEGTAEYVGVAASVLASVGCFARTLVYRDAVDNAALHHVKAFNGTFDRDYESYVIGLFASVILADRTSTPWAARIEAGETPAGVLLANIPPASTHDDLQLEIAERHFYDQQNKRNWAIIEPFRAAVSAHDTSIIAIPPSRLSGSFSSGQSFVNFRMDHTIEQILPRALAQFGTSVDLLNQDTAIGPTPCGAAFWFPVANHDIRFIGTRISIQTQSVRVSELHYSTLVGMGRRWLCVKP